MLLRAPFHLARPLRLLALLALACQALAWDGPTTGPAAQTGKQIIFIGSDAKNGGVSGLFRGFEEAAHKLGWQAHFLDGEGHRETMVLQLEAALAAHPDAIVFGGFQPDDFPEAVSQAKQAGIVLAGWHAGAAPGPTRSLFVNVSTSAADVAELAARSVIRDAAQRKRTVGVVIFNDSQFTIANLKAARLKGAIERCEGYHDCTVLSIEDVAISDAARIMPEQIPKLLARYGTRWTYTLAINDIYFDNMNYPLVAGHRQDILNVAAGDGSLKAIGRIRSGLSQQLATVGEPLRLQGYQLADELNRAFAHAPASGYVSKPVLISTTQAGESDLDFIRAYQNIWMAH